jgi:hypothetical protein
MKKSLIIFLILLFAWSCEQIEPDLTGIGEVKFQSVLVDSFSGNLPNGRIAGPSTWKHVFKNTAVMEIKNKVTGQEYKFDYNPNEFGEGIKFPLPYGSYTYKTKVSGGAFEKFLPFRAEGEFNLGVASLKVSIQATTDYGLITVKNEYVKSIAIRYGSETCEFKLLPDQSFYFIYAKKDQIAKMEIIESLTDKLIKRDVPVAAYNHYNFFLKLAPINGTVNFIELALGVFEYVEEGIEIDTERNLVMWNKLGSLFEVENSEVGPNGVPIGEIDFGAAKFDNGVVPKQGDASSGVNFPNNIFNPESGTVEFWFNPYFFPEPYSYGLYAFVLNRNEGDLPLVMNVYWWGEYTSLNFDLFFDYADALPIEDQSRISYNSFSPNLNEPVHVAVVWDRNGIEDSEQTQRIYVNGELVSFGTKSNWGTNNYGITRMATGIDSNYEESRYAMDNIKVYNYAKTDFSDRVNEGN